MHPATRHFFDKYINEELTPSQKRRVDTWKTGDNSFSDHAFDKGEDRATHPLESPNNPQSEHLPKIEQHLSQHGFKVKDYTAGKATDKYGREVNIGKALNKTGASDELKKGFESDPSRGQAKTGTSNLNMTVSRHPHDVAGMTSKGHSWEEESCMNFSSGSNREYLRDDVMHGTHVAYLHHKDDTEMKRPLARIALKKYTNIDDPNDHILRPEHRTYGNAPDSFSHTTNRWVNKNFPGRSDAIYKKRPEVYDDTGNNYVIGEHALDKAVVHPNYEIRKQVATNPSLTSKHLDTLMLDSSDRIPRAALKNPNINADHVDTAYRRGIATALTHPKASKKLLTDVLTSKDRHDEYVHNEWARGAAASNPNATKAHLDKAINDPEEMVRKNAAYNPNLNSGHLSKLIDDHSETVRVAAVHHPNLTARHISMSLNNEMHPEGSRAVLANLAAHKNLNSSHIDRMLNHDSASVRRYAIRSLSASSANITKGLNDEHDDVRQDAIKHPYANSSHITKALKDQNENVRTLATMHPNFGPEHMALALHRSQSLNIRSRAARHPAATSTHISMALKDEHIGVRMNALENPNATPEHIEKGINDPSEFVRTRAINHPNVTREQLQRVANGPEENFSTGEAQTLLKKKRK
jgi:hypothetical protein